MADGNLGGQTVREGQLKTVVFAGPTISRPEIARIVPGSLLRPPIQRGDLRKMLDTNFDRSATVVVVVDGLFGSIFAPTAGEFADACSAGMRVIGTASMGAFRAVECELYGMVGYGHIYEAFNSGEFSSDAEVAVAVAPDRDYAATTVALADVRTACAVAVASNLLSKAVSEEIVQLMAMVHYLERTPQLMRRLLNSRGLMNDGEFDTWMRGADAKLRDARACLRAIQEGRIDWPPHRPAAMAERLSDRSFPPSIQGMLVTAEAQRRFSEWLLSTGRAFRHGLQLAPSDGPEFNLGGESVIEHLLEHGQLDSEVLLWNASLALGLP